MRKLIAISLMCLFLLGCGAYGSLKVIYVESADLRASKESDAQKSDNDVKGVTVSYGLISIKNVGRAMILWETIWGGNQTLVSFDRYLEAIEKSIE